MLIFCFTHGFSIHDDHCLNHYYIRSYKIFLFCFNSNIIPHLHPRLSLSDILNLSLSLDKFTLDVLEFPRSTSNSQLMPDAFLLFHHRISFKSHLCAVPPPSSLQVACPSSGSLFIAPSTLMKCSVLLEQRKKMTIFIFLF